MDLNLNPNLNPNSNPDADESLKLATAIALIRSKLSSSSQSDSQRWKRKAKDRKREILILKQQIKEIEDGSRCDPLPDIVSCKCHFFEGRGKLTSRGGGDVQIDEVLHRRFLRLGSVNAGYDVQSCVQHLLRKLGSDPYIGQRTMLLVSQKLYTVSDSMLLMDPFDDAFPNSHGSVFMMIQLTEFLISDYIQYWTKNEEFDKGLFEQWVRSIGQVRKVFNVFESRNGLYILYMDRVIGELLKQMGPISINGVLDMGILDDLLH